MFLYCFIGQFFKKGFLFSKVAIAEGQPVELSRWCMLLRVGMSYIHKSKSHFRSSLRVNLNVVLSFVTTQQANCCCIGLKIALPVTNLLMDRILAHPLPEIQKHAKNSVFPIIKLLSFKTRLEEVPRNCLVISQSGHATIHEV